MVVALIQLALDVSEVVGQLACTVVAANVSLLYAAITEGYV